ncbi:MAG: hypothetical protein ACO1SX_08540 [Actinomycetota bacterium]
MELLFRVLGLVARISERMSRFRVNFIPSNLGVMAVLLVVFFSCSVGALSAFAGSGGPATIRLVDLLAHRDPSASYVRVTGNLYSGAALVARSGRSEDSAVAKTWMPLVDGSGKRGILVERNTPTGTEAGIKTVEITGMLEPMDEDLQAKLKTTDGKLDGIKLDTEYTLAEERSPGDPWSYTLAAVISGTLLGLLLVTFAMQYVVFRPVTAEPGLPVAVDETREIDLRVTGSFVLNGAHRQRFLNMPAAMGRTETGEVLFVSNIDASSRFMGFTTNKREGYWVVPIQPGSVPKFELGRLYVGLAVRPAVRFRYQEPQARPTQTAIVSFENEAERTAAMRDLQGWVSPAAAQPSAT